MLLPYRYGLLKPLRALGANEHNAAWLGPDTLGIEVTEPDLAASCGLGNIDPQHLGGDPDTAAIEAALSWPPPAPQATLVTLRPDTDAIGAMAVLTLRVSGTILPPEAQERIGLISRFDRFDHGPWLGLRPLPTRVDDIDEVGVGPQRLGAIIGGLALPGTPIEQGVERTTHWILTGEAPREWVAQAEKVAATLLVALQEGSVAVREAFPGRIAVVEGFVPGALRLGYRRAPVVVAVASLRQHPNRAPLRKITIAQYERGYADLEKAARLLSAVEPGWGGSATIIGSPQGTDCRTTVERCIGVLLNVGVRGLIGLGRSAMANEEPGSGPASQRKLHCAYLFEAKGIQRYILDSGPLRDLVGASDLVAGLASSNGNDLLKEVLKQIKINGRQITVVKELDGKPYKVAFSRRAGGAFCIHGEKETLNKVKALWRLVVSLRCPGLEFSDTGPVEAKTDTEALQRAYRSGGTERHNSAAELPPSGHPFTSFNPRTGRLTTRLHSFKDGEVVPLDVLTAAQREHAEQTKGRLDGVAERYLPEGYRTQRLRYFFPLNLTQKENEREEDKWDNPLFPFAGDDRRLAVIHADLSGLAQTFRTATDPKKMLKVDDVFEVAKAIESAVVKAAQDATDEVLLRDGAVTDWRHENDNRQQRIIAARPVVLGGDDLTILVRADFAIPFTLKLLKNIEVETQSGFALLKNRYNAEQALFDANTGLPPYLSACAGIAIVRAGQPFTMAYALADSLASFAKKHAKFVHGNVDRPRERKPYPSMLAFHNVLSTLQEEYGAIYSREMTPLPGADRSERGKRAVRLTANPYLIVTDASKQFVEDLTAAPNWPFAANGEIESEKYVQADRLLALADALYAAKAGRSKLVEVGKELFHDHAIAMTVFARWVEVLTERDNAAFTGVQEALNAIGLGKIELDWLCRNTNDSADFRDRLNRLVGPVSDALELIDFGAFETGASA